MTTTTPTATTRATEAGTRVRAAGSTALSFGGRLMAALARFAERGQLGATDERERGRRTGARA
jgi:hypothetical protein